MGSDGAGSHSFWATLPGILTGIAALVTAVVGAVVLLRGNGAPSGSDAAGEPAPMAAAPAAAGATGDGDAAGAESGSSVATPPPSSSDAGAPTDVAGAARYVLLEDDYLDVESGLVGTGVVGDLQWQSEYLWVHGDARARVPAPTDVAGCRDVLARRTDAAAVEPADVRRGVVLCLRTGDGTVALLEAGPPDGRGQLPVTVTAFG